MIPLLNVAVLLVAAAVAWSVPPRVMAQGGDTASTQRREAHPQTTPPHGIGPHGVGEIRVEQLLQAFGWDTLRAACRGRSPYNRDHCSAQSDLSRDSLLVYHTLYFTDRTDVSITSFDGRVVRYSISRVERQGTHLDATYFNPFVWTEYARRALGPAGEGLHIAPDAYPASAVEAYYHLLGVEVRREYGWTCEYGTVGKPPPQRSAVMQLTRGTHSDLLRRLLRAPDVETRLYAADALLYLNGQVGAIRRALRGDAEPQKVLELYRITPEDLRLIGELRRSGEMVRTCGNQGSGKIYMRPAREVLTAREVRSIPANYADLRRVGYRN